MKFLNLSPSLRYTPEIPYESFVFHGGEPHIKLSVTDLRPDDTVRITLQATSADQWILALLAADALKRQRVARVELFIPYFPGARQDRVMQPGEPLSAAVFAGLIKSASFDRILLFDPHSDVTPALLDRCTVLGNAPFVRAVMQWIKSDRPLYLIAPDSGAAKKIQHLAEALGHHHIVFCAKNRDVTTGKLSQPAVFADDLGGADCLIVDDICDGGGTFMQLAEALKAKNAGRLFLAVSHGIFSKGRSSLLTRFDEVFTTNSFYSGTEGLIRLEDIYP